MSHSIGSQLSDEDYQLSEVNQLGMPLDIYRLKPGPIRFLYGGGLFLLVLGVAVLALVITGWHKAPTVDDSVVVLLVTIAVGSLLSGLFILGITLLDTRSERVLLCEHGLLQVKKHLGSTHVEVVRWNDIQAIKRDGFRSYYIVQQGKGALTLTLYQKVDELVELIRQRSREG